MCLIEILLAFSVFLYVMKVLIIYNGRCLALLLVSVSDVVETRCNIDALFLVDMKGEGP